MSTDRTTTAPGQTPAVAPAHPTASTSPFGSPESDQFQPHDGQPLSRPLSPGFPANRHSSWGERPWTAHSPLQGSGLQRAAHHAIGFDTAHISIFPPSPDSPPSLQRQCSPSPSELSPHGADHLPRSDNLAIGTANDAYKPSALGLGLFLQKQDINAVEDEPEAAEANPTLETSESSTVNPSDVDNDIDPAMSRHLMGGAENLNREEALDSALSQLSPSILESAPLSRPLFPGLGDLHLSNGLVKPQVSPFSSPSSTLQAKVEQETEHNHGSLQTYSAANLGDTTNLRIQKSSEENESDTLITSLPELPALSSDLAAQIDGLFPGMEAPTFEALTATTAAANDRGEFMQAINQLWQQRRMTFVAAARQVAATDEVPRGGPRPLHSPGDESGDLLYRPRYALVLNCENYPRSWGRTPHIANPTAQLEMDHDNVLPVTDPTSDDIRQHIQATIETLASQVRPREVGRLTIHIWAHGGGQGVYGVDAEEPVSFADLTDLGHLAQRNNIHLVYVISACNIGNAVLMAQGTLGTQLSQQSTDLPDSIQEQVKALLFHSRAIGQPLVRLNYSLADFYAFRRQVSQCRSDSCPITNPVNNSISDGLSLLVRFIVEKLDLIDEALENLMSIQDLIDTETISIPQIRLYLVGTRSIAAIIAERQTRHQDIHQLRRYAEPLLNGLNDLLNTLLNQARTLVDQASTHSDS